MMDFFFIVGLTIFIGYLANYIFEKSKISTVLILMLFGFLIGPVLGLVDTTTGSIINAISEIVALIALVVLLFDGGMMLDILSVIKSISKSTVFTITTF